MAHDRTRRSSRRDLPSRVEKLAGKLRISFDRLSSMEPAALLRLLAKVAAFGLQREASDEDRGAAGELVICFIEDCELPRQLQQRLTRLADQCLQSPCPSTVAAGIELTCNVMVSMPSPTKVVRERLFSSLMEVIRSGASSASADEAICGLMLIAGELRPNELETYTNATRQRVRDGYRNPIVMEFLAELDVYRKSKETLGRRPRLRMSKDCQFICALSRKGGTGKTSVLLGTLLHLNEQLGKQRSKTSAQLCVIDLDTSGPSWPFLFPLCDSRRPSAFRRAVFLTDYLELGDSKRVSPRFFNSVDTTFQHDGEPCRLRFDVAFLNPLHGSLSKINRLFDAGNTALLKRLESLLRFAASKYRYVLVDCSPGLYEAGRVILYLSLQSKNWYRVIVSGPQLADVAGVAYEMDTFLLDMTPRGRDLWLINQVPPRILGAYADEERITARPDLLTNVASGWPLLGYLPKQTSLLNRLADAYEKRAGAQIYALPLDGRLREKNWTLEQTRSGRVRSVGVAPSLHQLRTSLFYRALEGVLSRELIGM